MTLLPTPRATFGHARLYEFGAASADRAAIPVVLRRLAGGQLRRPLPMEETAQLDRAILAFMAGHDGRADYPRGSGESVTRSWQRPASQAARVSWMSRRVRLSAVI
jgi:hypothetical protein